MSFETRTRWCLPDRIAAMPAQDVARGRMGFNRRVLVSVIRIERSNRAIESFRLVVRTQFSHQRAEIDLHLAIPGLRHDLVEFGRVENRDEFTGNDDHLFAIAVERDIRSILATLITEVAFELSPVTSKPATSGRFKTSHFGRRVFDRSWGLEDKL